MRSDGWTRKSTWPFILGAAIVVGIVLVLFAIVVSTALHIPLLSLPDTAAACIREPKDCSLALGTWTLALATALAFVAAGFAAVYTGRLVRLEHDRMVSITPCRDAAHSAIPPVSSITIADNGILSAKTPGARELGKYVPVLYEVLNLSRMPLLQFTAKCGFQQGGLKSTTPCDVTFGNIAEHGVVHVGVYLHSNFPARFDLEFTDLKSKRGSVEFHGTDKERPGKVEGNVAIAIPFGNAGASRDLSKVGAELVTELRGIKDVLTPISESAAILAKK